ncbi:MAG: histidinol dehydrogenase [Candidatus Dormibacteraeota bacterium]|nr:histidinol dehydrogenase [Candidatus Dormibacteraeota bacterium]
MIAVDVLPTRGTAAYRLLVERQAVPEEVRSQTRALLGDVQRRGDAALLELTERFDGVRLQQTRVSSQAIAAALDKLDRGLRSALEVAAANIQAVHSAQRFQEEPVDVVRGVRVWREWRPFRRVGIYVPGGRTVYPSSVLMLAIPARLAGCPEVVMCSPPQRDGQVAPAILAAAALAGVTEIHAIGGAQAIAALAYGTESVGRVDKIFGPGNAYVTAAKLAVFGEVAVDMPAGPSEILVLTDGSVPAPWVAADLRAQAEHAPDARAILISTDPTLATEVRKLVGGELSKQVQVLNVTTMEAAIAFANDFAPEHLTLACIEPDRWLPQIFAAGSVFLGPYAPAAAGDYATGGNHVLPTGGGSRSFSALGVDAFGRTMQVQSLDRDGLHRLERVVDAIAGAERLIGHRDSVRARVTESVAFPPLNSPLPRGAIMAMQPYEWEPPSARIATQAGVAEADVVRFDTNTTPWPGASLSDLEDLPLNEYPDTSYAMLADELAEYTGVPLEQITVGAGADELLDLVAKAYVGAGDPVVLSRPTYAMFRIVSEMAGGRVEAVPAAGLDMDQDRFLLSARHARLTWLCNPNNPTGELLPADFIPRLAEETAGVVAVDEAYFEFSGATSASLLARFPNLVLIRTLSKAFGLAGVRVGYALAGPLISAALRRVRPPDSVSVVSEALGARALRNQSAMRQRVSRIVECRETLLRDLTGLDLPVHPSAANFLLVRTGEGAAPWLLRRGLVVRTFPSTSPLAEFIRITVRTAEENARLVDGITDWRRHAG